MVIALNWAGIASILRALTTDNARNYAQSQLLLESRIERVPGKKYSSNEYEYFILEVLE